jgi:hypothetical protein
MPDKQSQTAPSTAFKSAFSVYLDTAYDAIMDPKALVEAFCKGVTFGNWPSAYDKSRVYHILGGNLSFVFPNPMLLPRPAPSGGNARWQLKGDSVFFWDPLVMFGQMPQCPKPTCAGHNSTREGWAPVPRVVKALDHDVYIYAQKCKCKGCKFTFTTTQLQVIEKMPFWVQAEFPFHLTERCDVYTLRHCIIINLCNPSVSRCHAQLFLSGKYFHDMQLHSLYIS